MSVRKILAVLAAYAMAALLRKLGIFEQQLTADKVPPLLRGLRDQTQRSLFIETVSELKVAEAERICKALGWKPEGLP